MPQEHQTKSGINHWLNPNDLAEIEKIQLAIEQDLRVPLYTPSETATETGFTTESLAAPLGSATDAEPVALSPLLFTPERADTAASAELTHPAAADAAEDTPDYAADTVSRTVEIIKTDTFAQDTEISKTIAIAKTDEHPAAPLSAPSESAFYQETIKEGNRKRHPAFRKMVAFLCIICTLGTATLGMGIGFIIPYAQNFWQRGISGQNTGDNVQDSPAYGIESTRYVFSDILTEGEQAASLADIVRLVEPSVVSVMSVFQTSGSVYDAAGSGDASGIIFAEDDRKIYVATNYHVINGASAVNVSITGSTPLPAKLVGREPEADLAVISLDKKDAANAGVKHIVIAVFGDSDALEVGDSVLAIGNAMGEGNSATFGIISAKEKTIPIQNRQLTVLQTDAAINPGNSGGPLVNIRGEVVGINTAKFSSNYYAYSIEGMGYSISSNVAKPIIEDIMRSYPRPFLGIQGEQIKEADADTLGIPPVGVMVLGVIKDTGAEKAGIVRTDVITSFNGSAVFDMEQLANEVKKCNVGDTVEVKILREGRLLTLQVKLGENTDDNF